MPERSFGRTVRYRRTKLGLSQARLAELVGRSPATIRSWEAERTTPNDTRVLATLSAIIGVDERTLFGKAGVALPADLEVETSPTVEQALASIAPEGQADPEASPTVEEVLASFASESDEQLADEPDDEPAITPTATPHTRDRRRARLRAVPRPLPQRVPEQASVTTLTPVAVREASYIEDPAQRQFYQVRTLASVVGLVALAIALLWAVGHGLDALGNWWNDFFDGLRL